MIKPDELTQLIQESIPDAKVDMIDKTGEWNHYILRVVSPAFAGVGLMDRHRMVYTAVDAAMKDGRLHAIELQTAEK